VDIDFARPRFRAVSRINLAADSSHVAKESPSVAIADVPTNKSFILTPKKIDYTTGAKAYKKKRRANNLYNYVCKALFVFGFFGIILVAGGLFINHKFQGRALPLTYIGDISIGGMTKQQIKKTLDDQFGNMMITFVDGGLVRRVPINQLHITLDTGAVSEQAVPKRINPFSYLNWQRFEVPVNINDRIIAGYVQTQFNSSQTKSEDAQLVIEKNKLKVNGELVGFQTDPKNVVQQIKYSLARASEPNINVNVVTLKPKVIATDLTDDFNRANSLLQTPITIKYGYANFRPTLKQKMAWLELTHVPGSTYVSIDFSKGLIRNYILDQVKRMHGYQYKTATNSNSSTQLQQNSFAIDNIDEVATAVVNSLKTGIAVDQKLSVRNIDNKTISTNDASNTVATALSN